MYQTAENAARGTNDDLYTSVLQSTVGVDSIYEEPSGVVRQVRMSMMRIVNGMKTRS